MEYVVLKLTKHYGIVNRHRQLVEYGATYRNAFFHSFVCLFLHLLIYLQIEL